MRLAQIAQQTKLVLSAKLLASALFVTVLIGSSVSTRAASPSIGASFAGRDGGGNTLSASQTLLRSDSAGVFAQTNWNNIDSGSSTFSGTSLSLIDSAYNSTGVKIIYNCSDSWNSDGGSTTPDAKLMKGIIKANPTPDTTPPFNGTDRMIFVVTNLPPTAVYNVVVYVIENGTGAECSVNLGATTYYVEQENNFTDTPVNSTYIQNASTTPGAYADGNYCEFDGVSPAGNGTITITVVKNIVTPQINDGAGVAGIQLVQVSGPAPSPNGDTCSVTSDPQNTLTVAGSTATFTVGTAGPAKVQWQRDGVDIPGQIDPIMKYTASLADDQHLFRAKVYNNVNTTFSSNAVLSVDAPTPPTVTQGFMYVQRWENIGGGTGLSGIGDLKTNIPGSGVTGTTPTTTFYVGGANEPQTNPNIDNFGSRISGWVKPDVTGDYNFFIRSDDSSELYLNPVNSGSDTNMLPDVQTNTPVCWEYNCCNPFQEPPAPTATATPIHLEAGKLYGMVILHKEGGGNDFAQVAWRMVGDPTPAGQLQPIPPNNVYIVTSGAGHRTTIGIQPVSTTVFEGGKVNFHVSSTTVPTGDPVAYQWLTNGTLIPSAQGTTYTIKSAVLAPDMPVKARLYTLAGPQDTTNATLHVIPDPIPPVAQVGTIIRNDGAIQVGVGFDKPVNSNDLVSANFSLSGGTVSFPTNSYGDYKGVLFDTTGLVVGNTYSVHVANVRNLSGNGIPSAGTNVSFTVGNRMGWADTGTPIRPGQVVPVGPDGFDVLNGGRQAWGSYDEQTIAYIKKTNDFDVKVQVINAEPSSEWARVGLIARNNLNVGEDPNDRNITNGVASAYADTHINPNETIWSSSRNPAGATPANTPPNNSHEQNERIAMGATSLGWQSTANAGAPSFPDVWLRLQRTGATLTGYASTNGVTWAQQGQTNLFDQQPSMNVGPFMCVETGNIWTTTDHDVWAGPFDPNFDRLFVAQFRNFGNTFPPGLSISISNTTVIVTFTGQQLLASPSLSGPWTGVATSSPYTTPATPSPRFFRAQD